jgi:hypothetical protein
MLFDDLANYSAGVDSELKATEEAAKSKESVFDFGKTKRYVTAHESSVTVLRGTAKRPRRSRRSGSPRSKKGAPNWLAIWGG